MKLNDREREALSQIIEMYWEIEKTSYEEMVGEYGTTNFEHIFQEFVVLNNKLFDYDEKPEDYLPESLRKELNIE